MVVNGTHSLSSDMMASMQEFRQQLAEKRAQEKAQQPPTDAPTSPESPQQPEYTPYEPVDPVDPYRVPGDPTFVDQSNPIDTAQEAVQENRERAREASVAAAQMQHSNKMFDTYMRAASSGSSSESDEIRPIKVYKEVADYYNRQDLVKGFEKAQEPDELFAYNYEQIRVEV